MKKDPFPNYEKIEEKKLTIENKKYAWSTAIGLQEVDNLKPSKYLISLSKQNINGVISLPYTNQLLEKYYQEKNERKELETSHEADMVSLKITELLLNKSFSFSLITYISIHKQLFENIYSHAGKVRTYNIEKKEWVLDGDSVLYGDFNDLEKLVEYDINQEKNINFFNFKKEELIKHFAKFLANIWQAHIFLEGNTRTTAVFFIKYLNSLGFKINNDIFSKHSWYFRNALVRANYFNYEKGIKPEFKYLELFLKNLIFNEKNTLSNKDLLIDKNKK